MDLEFQQLDLRHVVIDGYKRVRLTENTEFFNPLRKEPFISLPLRALRGESFFVCSYQTRLETALGDQEYFAARGAALQKGMGLCPLVQPETLG